MSPKLLENCVPLNPLFPVQSFNLLPTAKSSGSPLPRDSMATNMVSRRLKPGPDPKRCTTSSTERKKAQAEVILRTGYEVLQCIACRRNRKTCLVLGRYSRCYCCAKTREECSWVKKDCGRRIGSPATVARSRSCFSSQVS